MAGYKLLHLTAEFIYAILYHLFIYVSSVFEKKPTETVQMILLFKFYFLKQDMNKSFVLLGVKEKRGWVNKFKTITHAWICIREV